MVETMKSHDGTSNDWTHFSPKLLGPLGVYLEKTGILVISKKTPTYPWNIHADPQPSVSEGKSSILGILGYLGYVPGVLLEIFLRLDDRFGVSYELWEVSSAKKRATGNNKTQVSHSAG